MINAENYHALQALLYTHEGKVDAIYIDPPYNTGAKDWKYINDYVNNDYVDGEDAYRHSTQSFDKQARRADTGWQLAIGSGLSFPARPGPTHAGTHPFKEVWA